MLCPPFNRLAAVLYGRNLNFVSPSSDNSTPAASLSRFLEHTHTPVGLLCTSDQLVAEASTIAAHNKHKDEHPHQQSSGFRPHGLEYTSTRIGRKTDITSFN
jgi:GMP synthase-like glutamine amidotransferase